MTAPLLQLDDVSRTYASGGLLTRRRIRAVDGVSFSIAADRPEIFAIIGESGSGKTTLARMILNIVPPTAGTHQLPRRRRWAHAWRRRERLDFMRQVQPIFQNPFEAFNPLKRVDRYLFVDGAAVCRDAQPGGCGAACRPGAAPGGTVARRGQQAFPARTVGRPVAAHRDRPSADLLAGADRGGRTGVHGGRIAAHVHRQPVRVAARRAGRVDHLHHPRPRDRLHDQRPHHHHAPRPRGGGRRCPGRARQSAASVFDPAQERGAVAGCAPDEGRSTKCAQSPSSFARTP